MDLNATHRTTLGRKVNTLRKEGLVPAELYGHGIENIHLSVDAKKLEEVYDESGESVMVNLVIDADAGKKRPIIINDLALDPVTDEILSADFYQVRLDEKITVYVPIIFTGVSGAVKDEGGILVKAMQEIEVEALPNDVPKEIVVDISKINHIGESIHISDMDIASNIEVLVDAETVIATVTEKASEEEEQVASAEIDVDAVKTEAEIKSTDKDSKEEAEKSE
jgi:large subunit ribosomal protein L25